MAVSATGAIGTGAAGASLGTSILPGIGTIVGGVIGAVVGLFSGGGGESGAEKAARAVAQEQVHLLWQQQAQQKELFDVLKPYAEQEAKIEVEKKAEELQAQKDKELIDIFSIGLTTGAKAQAQPQVTVESKPFDYLPFLIGGGVIAGILIFKKRR